MSTFFFIFGGACLGAGIMLLVFIMAWRDFGSRF